MKGAPEFFEVIKFMKDKGFVVYDILNGFYRPLDKALGQVDIVFVKEDGKFRKTIDLLQKNNYKNGVYLVFQNKNILKRIKHGNLIPQKHNFLRFKKNQIQKKL